MLDLKFIENRIEYGNFKIWLEPNEHYIKYDVYFKDSHVFSFESLEDAIKYVRD